MNMKKRLFTLRTILASGIICLFISSCGNENKSITEPLTFEERKELINKDKEYSVVFSMLDLFEKIHPQPTSSEKATMKELSYKRLKNFVSEWTDTDKTEKRKKKYEEEWEKMYKDIYTKVDSIDKHWNNFLEKYIPNRYLKIELVDIVDKTDVYLGYVKVRLRFTPLKGKVNKVTAYFSLEGSMQGRNEVEVNKTFSSPIEVEDWMSFNYAFDINASKVNDLPVKKLLAEYEFETNITQLVVEGRTIDYMDGYNQVPDCVRDMWTSRYKHENDWEGSYYKEYAYNQIVKELIDPSMPSKDDYVNTHIKNDAYNYDNLAATYYYEMWL